MGAGVSKGPVIGGGEGGDSAEGASAGEGGNDEGAGAGEGSGGDDVVVLPFLSAMTMTTSFSFFLQLSLFPLMK